MLRESLGFKDVPALVVRVLVVQRIDGSRVDRGSGRGGTGCFFCTEHQVVEVDECPGQTAAQEDHEQHEHDTQDELPGRAQVEHRLEEVAEQQPRRGAQDRPEERARAADGGHHHDFAGRGEHERIGRHEALHHGQQPAAETGVHGGHDEHHELVAVDVVPERRGTIRIFANGAHHQSEGRTHDAQRNHQTDEEPEREERVQRQVALEVDRREAEPQAGRGHARQAVFTTGVFRKGIELHEEEHLGNGHRDHREVDAGAAQRHHAHQVARHRRNDRAQDESQHDIGKRGLRKQVGGEHAAGAEEGRLPEGQQAGVAEQQVEADAHQTEDHDPVDGGWREPEGWQDERDGDQHEQRHQLGEERYFSGHLRLGISCDLSRPSNRGDGRPGQASLPRRA